MTRPWTTELLADFALGVRAAELSPTTAEMVRRCALDAVGAAAAGHASPSATALRHAARRLFAPGPAAVWFSGERLAPAAAALANSGAASALDLDDGHRAAGGHPGASILPAALAAAGAVGATGPELLTAVAVGYEVAVRVSAARDFAVLDTLSTGRWCAYGAAAAAGRLLGVDRDSLAQALALAGVLSPGLSAAGYSQLMGNGAKEGIPWATLLGLTALELAPAGYTGPLDVLDHPTYYDAARIRDGLGESWAVERVYFKPYACCRWIHAAVDAVLALRAEHGFEPGEIRNLEVHTFERALRLSNETDPATLEGAQYSLPFCLAVAAVEGAAAFLPLAPDLLGRPDLVALARRIELRIDPELDARFPAQTPARVVLRTARGTWEHQVDFPRGDPDNPLSPAELEAKFYTLSAGALDPAAQDRVSAAVDALTDVGPGPLLAALKGPQGTK